MTEAAFLQILKQFGLTDAKIISLKKGYRNTSVHAIRSIDNVLRPPNDALWTSEACKTGSEQLDVQSRAACARDSYSKCPDTATNWDGCCRHYNLMIYKRESGMVEVIKTVNEIGLFLHEHGFPARYPRDSRVLQVYAGQTPQYAGLYNYLPGTTIAWEAYTRKHLVALGKTMSDMHSILGEYRPKSRLPQTRTVVKSYLIKAQKYLLDSGVQNALEIKLGLQVRMSVLSKALTAVEILGSSQRAQVLHMDFVRGNILFDDMRKVSGVLDFEKASYGNPLFDIARTQAFLYVDCLYKEPSVVVKTFLRSGYSKRGRAKIPVINDKAGASGTQKILEELVTAFLIYDFYKFLRHNPYEFLTQNLHFVRTRDQLIERGFVINCV